jgi:hypothetical protein
VIPEGQAPPEHEGVAKRIRVSPWFRVVEEGFAVTVTVESVGAVDKAVMVIMANPSALTPFRVALTQRDTLPAAVPAVNTTVAVVVELTVPMPLLAIVHR